MRLTHAVLVIADISGYTGFIRRREVSLLHAEEIVGELIEAILAGAERPLVLNKFEGDAVLFYVETGAEPQRVAAEVLASLRAGFEAFRARLDTIRGQRTHCRCDACANVGALSLKAFVHAGDIAIKQVRQFEELAGDEVILIHRLLKNRVDAHEYLLLTEDFAALAAGSAALGTAHVEHAEGLGEVRLRVLPVDAQGLSALGGRAAITAPAAIS